MQHQHRPTAYYIPPQYDIYLYNVKFLPHYYKTTIFILHNLELVFRNEINETRIECDAGRHHLLTIHIFNLNLYLIHIIIVIIYYGFGVVVVVCAWSLLLHSKTHFTNPPSFRLLLYLTLINRFLGWTGTNGIIRYGYISVYYIFFFRT